MARSFSRETAKNWERDCARSGGKCKCEYSPRRIRNSGDTSITVAPTDKTRLRNAGTASEFQVQELGAVPDHPSEVDARADCKVSLAAGSRDTPEIVAVNVHVGIAPLWRVQSIDRVNSKCDAGTFPDLNSLRQ